MEYICDKSPKFKNISDEVFFSIKDKIENNIEVSDEEVNTFLSYVSDRCREILAGYLNVDILNDPLTNRCDLAQRIVGRFLEGINGIEIYPKETQNVIDPNVQGHSFSVCVINGKEYLIDLTFRQFFDKEKCSDSSFLIMDDKVLLAPYPGYILAMSDDDFGISSKLIENGFIKLSPSIAKTYCDSFYYTKQGERVYEKKFGEDYLKKLSEVNHEYIQSDEVFDQTYGSIKVR